LVVLAVAEAVDPLPEFLSRGVGDRVAFLLHDVGEALEDLVLVLDGLLLVEFEDVERLPVGLGDVEHVALLEADHDLLALLLRLSVLVEDGVARRCLWIPSQLS
jgi:hypothetical protein